MPIYEYLASGEGCAKCSVTFECVQKMSDEPLEHCPECGAAVRRVLSTFSVSGGDPLSPKRLEEKGFTQYVRRGKGNYEKTAGKGPRSIVDGNS